jgi:hypothetical protein
MRPIRSLIVLILLSLCVAAALPAPLVLAQPAPAQIHVLHLVADGPNVDVFIDDEAVLEDLAPGLFSDFLDVDPGEHTVALAPHGEGSEAAVSEPVTVAAGHRYTIAAMGQADDESLELLVIDETAEMEGVDMSRHVFRIVINNIAGSPPISFYEAGRFFEQNLAYGTYSALAVEPISWDTGLALSSDELAIIFPFDLENDQSSGYWEPYTVYVFGMMGHYPGQPDADYSFAMPSVTVVAPDVTSFLAAFTPFDLTEDYQTYLRFETLVAALEQTGVSETLAEGGPYTIFAPTDAAFAALSQRKLASLMDDPEALQAVLRNHVVEGALSYEEMLEAGSITTLSGTEVPVVESWEEEEYHFGLGEDVDVINFPYALPDGSMLYFIRNQVLLPASVTAGLPAASQPTDPTAMIRPFTAAQ